MSKSVAHLISSDSDSEEDAKSSELSQPSPKPAPPEQAPPKRMPDDSGGDNDICTTKYSPERRYFGEIPSESKKASSESWAGTDPKVVEASGKGLNGQPQPSVSVYASTLDFKNEFSDEKNNTFEEISTTASVYTSAVDHFAHEEDDENLDDYSFSSTMSAVHLSSSVQFASPNLTAANTVGVPTTAIGEQRNKLGPE